MVAVICGANYLASSGQAVLKVDVDAWLKENAFTYWSDLKYGVFFVRMN